MLDQESYILKQLLDEEDPQVRAILWAARSPGMRDSVPGLLRGLCRQRGIDPDNPPPVGLPVGISPSMYPVGRAKCGGMLGEPVGLSSEDLLGHIGVFGASGLGKTSLVKLLLVRFAGAAPGRSHFVCLDLHGEYADLVAHLPAGEAILLRPEELGLNPFEVPRRADGKPCMSPESWVGFLKEWIRAAWLNDPSVNRFAEVLLDLYRERGVLEGGEDYPCLSDVIAALEQMSAARGSDRAKAREKLIDRMSALRATLPGLDARRSRDIHELFWRHSVVLDLRDTADAALPLLFSLLVTVLTSAFEAEPGQPVSHQLVIEEAHLLLGGQFSKRTADLRENAKGPTS